MKTARRALFGKLSSALFQQLESATALARARGDTQITLTHWLLLTWRADDSDLRLILTHFGADDASLERDFSKALERQALRRDGRQLDFSSDLELAIERAWLVASVQAEDHRIRSAWLLFALLQHTTLRPQLLQISAQFERIPTTGLMAQVQHLLAESSEAEQEASDGSGAQARGPANDNAGGSALASYAQNLGLSAREGKLDPVVGRDREIRMAIDVLLRRRQNNPLLVGEAGVGKTAIVEGFALAVAAGQVPPVLQKARIFSLDVGGLLAGAGLRGEFEQRLRSVLEEACAGDDPTILFVDEVHTLVGAGGQAGTGDAANLLKPALARGKLRLIGATTWSEYKRHIEKDPALTRRFQVLQIGEPDDAAACAMVRSLVPSFHKHHGVQLLDEAVLAAVTLSRRYIPSRQLPDKAISLLDTACARIAMAQHLPPPALQDMAQSQADLQRRVDSAMQLARLDPGKAREADALDAQWREQQRELDSMRSQWAEAQQQTRRWNELRQRLSERADADLQAEFATLSESIRHHPLRTDQRSLLVDHDAVAQIVEQWTGIPTSQMLGDELSALRALDARLQERVLGQDAALKLIADRVRAARALLTDPGKPVGVFLLSGPSGVGKTETALALAEAMYGGEGNLITVHMSEFQEAHTVSTLKGSPPGYVGFGEGGVLTEAVRRRPYSVVLLDEVEKAHPDVHELFYQVFDKGCMDDGEGRNIDFKNTLILLTSNVGTELIQDLCADPATAPSISGLADALDAPLRRVFPAAFLGRVTVVPYRPLPSSLLHRIARMQLARVSERARTHHGFDFSASDAAVDAMVSQCGVHDTGARRIAQFIEQHVMPALAQAWLSRGDEPIHRARLDLGDHETLDPLGRISLYLDSS